MKQIYGGGGGGGGVIPKITGILFPLGLDISTVCISNPEIHFIHETTQGRSGLSSLI